MGVNVNESSPENMAAVIVSVYIQSSCLNTQARSFMLQRNAERLNGTATATDSLPSSTRSPSQSSQTASGSTTTQGSFAMRPFIPIIASSFFALTAAMALLLWYRNSIFSWDTSFLFFGHSQIFGCFSRTVVFYTVTLLFLPSCPTSPEC